MVRIKHRYLLINVLYPEQQPSGKQVKNTGPDQLPWTIQFRRPSSDQFNTKLLLRVVRDAVADAFGDYGSGMISASLQIKYISSATSTAIIRVSRANFRIVWAALSLVTRLPKPVDEPCVIQVVRVSGTMKKVEEEAVRQARRVILLAQGGKGVQGSALAGIADDMMDLDPPLPIDDDSDEENDYDDQD